jgi:uncharacterized protein Yka (UPF0111/DUF47 family)
MADVSTRSWFLPETPDVLGLLRQQLAVTVEGVDAFAEWAAGGEWTTAEVREIEERGDVAKRGLLEALQRAFVTPLEPEDLFTLSRSIDWILNDVGDLVAEAEALDCGPDQQINQIAKLLAEAVHHIEAAVAQLDVSAKRTTIEADAAVKAVRGTDQPYYEGIARTPGLEERGERIARRELYRRCDRLGDTVVDVAERIIYSVVKQS